MRLATLLVLVGTVTIARAQEASPPPPSPEPPPSYASPTYSSPSPSLPAPPPPPVVNVSRPSVPPSAVRRWRDARILGGFGTAFGLIGTALSLSSAIYIVATDYPPSQSDFLHPASPTDTAQILAYTASSASALGFAFSAGGLGWRHRILDELDADPGRALFATGAAFGIVGLVGVGAGYFFGLTDYLNAHDQSIAVLATSLGGAALCTLGSILFSADASRLDRAWQRLTTF